MKITVINGTEVRGCTYKIKEAFLDSLRAGNTITEFYLPKDLPHFCCGCKSCFLIGEAHCPHSAFVLPIWESLLNADLLVFTSPVYALRTTGQMKSLLDHLCVRWMVHRPDDRMFKKRAVILTDAIGVFNGGAQKDIQTSLRWLGVSDVKRLGIGLLEGVYWKDLSPKRRDQIVKKARRLARRYRSFRPGRKGIKVRFLFAATRAMHQMLAPKEKTLSVDNRYWLEKGWIKL